MYQAHEAQRIRELLKQVRLNPDSAFIDFNFSTTMMIVRYLKSKQAEPNEAAESAQQPSDQEDAAEALKPGTEPT